MIGGGFPTINDQRLTINEFMRAALLKFSPHRYIRPMLLLAAAFYFCFHALSGERGLYGLLKEQRRLDVLQEEMKQVSAERARLEHRVRLLSSDSLDLDLLDEQARRDLGYVAPGEVMILP